VRRGEKDTHTRQKLIAGEVLHATVLNIRLESVAFNCLEYAAGE
jgi:hypothetical protein